MALLYFTSECYCLVHIFPKFLWLPKPREGCVIRVTCLQVARDQIKCKTDVTFAKSLVVTEIAKVIQIVLIFFENLREKKF
jgi:hypothetical protein